MTRIEQIGEADEVCECGDYRSDHPNDGPCKHNSVGFDLCHAGQDCMKFRPMTTDYPAEQGEGM